MSPRGAGDGSGAVFRLKLLGPPEVEESGGTPVEGIPSLGLGLLAYLSLHSRRRTREHLASLLWPRSDPSRARHSLRQLLSTLRRLLPEVLVAEGSKVFLATGRPRDAAALLEKALPLLSVQGELVLLRAQALAASGRLPEAEAAMIEVELEPEDRRIQETLEEIEKWRVVLLPHSGLHRQPADA